MLSAITASLRKRDLDLWVRTGKGRWTRIVAYPGRHLPAAELDGLISDVRTVATKVLPGEQLNYGIFTGDKKRLDDAVLTVVYEGDELKPIAFNALASMDVTLHGKPLEVMHLGLVMVDPEVRSGGLSWVLYGLTCVVLFVRRQLRPLWISNVTQVPAIVGMVSETFSGVFPSPLAGSRQSFEHLLLMRQIMGRHRHVFGVGDDAGYDEERGVITNAYTGGSDGLKKTFEIAPKHRDETYNAFCREMLDYDRGDDVLQLGQIDLESVRRFLTKDVPRSSLPSLVGALAFVGLQRLVLPVIHWLSSDRQWGILRPSR